MNTKLQSKGVSIEGEIRDKITSISKKPSTMLSKAFLRLNMEHEGIMKPSLVHNSKNSSRLVSTAALTL